MDAAEMKRIKKQWNVCLFLATLLSVKYSFAQPSSTGYWITYNFRLNFNKHIGLHLDLNLRNYAFLHDLEQGLIRGAVYYNLPAEKLQFSAGAAWSHVEQYKQENQPKITAEERRLHQQLQWSSDIDRATVSHRYRMEERFFSTTSNLRFRYQLNVKVPLNKSKMENGALYLILMDEIFLNLDTPVFDRNRFLCSAGYFLTPHLRLECGMLWQMYERSNKRQVLFTIHHSINFHNQD